MEKIIDADNAEKGLTDISGVKKEGVEVAPEQTHAEIRHAADDVNKNGEDFVGKPVSDRRDISVNKEFAEDGCEGKTKPEPSDGAFFTEKVTDSSAEAEESVNSAGDLSEREKEDREFLELIKGRYRDAYRRRTESIIRKRLKGSKIKGGGTSLTAGECESEIPHTDAFKACSTETVNAISLGTGRVTPSETVNAATLDSGNPPPSDTGISTPSERKKFDVNIQKSINRSRPRENGVGGSVGMFTGINVSALNGSEILELLRRAETGEKIRFK